MVHARISQGSGYLCLLEVAFANLIPRPSHTRTFYLTVCGEIFFLHSCEVKFENFLHGCEIE